MNISITRLTRLVVAILVLLFAGAHASAQDARYVPLTGETPLFSENSLLEVTITAPLTTLMEERPDEEYLAGTFSLATDEGEERILDLKLRTRGKYRRDKSHCDFTPIRLNFKKDQLFDTVLAGQDKLKVVTHCRSRDPRFDQLVLREYLAYRIFNLLTDKSYRVRLMRINYVDTEAEATRTRLGFVIEDDDHVAQRNGMQVVKRDNLEAEDLDLEQQNLVDVFQYMIGNTEYSLHVSEPNDDCCHNTDLMSVDGEKPYTPLPYDFDFAGLVSAPYAEPNPRYKLRHVRQRLYKGLCSNNDRLAGTVQRFLDRKDAVFELVDQLDGLNGKSRKQVVAYLNTFYKRIADPRSVRVRLEYKCRGRL